VFPPAIIPLTFHWYTGEVPGFVAVAVNVTWLPRQEGFDEAVIEMLTGCIGLTIMVMAFEVAVLIVTQVEFEII